MRIDSLSSFNHNKLQYSPKPRVSFGAYYDSTLYGKSIENHGDGVLYKSCNIHNYSTLIRSTELFLELPKVLEEKFPNGAKIYNYACSAGYEPTSLALSLHNYFPEEKAKKYLPIIARDNNSKIIAEAQKYTLRLEQGELNRLKFFENINEDDFFTLGKIRNRYGEKIYKLNDKLKNEIKFEEGDLFKDLDSGELSKEPCVILFRNAWQFLTEDGVKTLSKNLYEKLKPGSLVIIGAMDVPMEYYSSPNANIHLKKAGFKNLNDKYSIDFNDKDLRKKYIYLKKDNFEFIPYVQKYCYEK